MCMCECVCVCVCVCVSYVVQKDAFIPSHYTICTHTLWVRNIALLIALFFCAAANGLYYLYTRI